MTRGSWDADGSAVVYFTARPMGPTCRPTGTQTTGAYPPTRRHTFTPVGMRTLVAATSLSWVSALCPHHLSSLDTERR